MILLLQTLTLGDQEHITEMTIDVSRTYLHAGLAPNLVHIFIHHPLGSETDALLQRNDKQFKAPIRFGAEIGMLAAMALYMQHCHPGPIYTQKSKVDVVQYWVELLHEQHQSAMPAVLPIEGFLDANVVGHAAIEASAIRKRKLTAT